MKVNINLYTETYPVITIGYNDSKYIKDFAPDCKEWFNCEVPNELLKKWIQVFIDFENTQKEISKYFGDIESYRPNFCEFSSLDEIK